MISSPWPSDPPPDLSKERMESKQKPSTLPKWWNKMYSRQAKGISSATWSNLMKPVDWKEVLQTIKSSGSEKAAGLDGVSSDLVKILTEVQLRSQHLFYSLLSKSSTYLFEMVVQWSLGGKRSSQ